MAFDSLEAFITMGGHGPYVWSCYFVFFALSLVLIQWSRVHRRFVLRTLARGYAEPDTAGTSRASADFARVDTSDH
ncbi:heme exporter protein CcmD [Marinobacter confluentis]|uniref:Heme exporter protein D n=1 Tax=Marinobacter confluentis TaxID=1697557 RepID=A0A4Z1C6R3_9GAMM|nr:heme exporter protein CcmD [Marinobacter confluentis]TGN41260.1 heme exporter protein CcmD [Marinobacter confluentis]